METSEPYNVKLSQSLNDRGAPYSSPVILGLTRDSTLLSQDEETTGQARDDKDAYYMNEALKEARHAYNLNEVPIGCVIVKDDKIIARAANERVTRGNVLYHAEILAIGQACEAIGDWRLEDCRIYITIEPCPMCAGAIIQARIPMVVYGAKNPKAGCGGSILNILEEPRFNHQAQVISGVLEEECANIMKEFFQRFR